MHNMASSRFTADDARKAEAFRQAEAVDVSRFLAVGLAAASSGIADHSTESPYKSYVVFAVGDLLRSAQFTAWATQAGLPFKQGIGSYKGTQERCFIVPEVDALIADLEPWLAGQETVLRLGPAYRNGIMYGHRRAELFDVEPNGSWIGPFASSIYLGLYGWVGSTHAPEGDWTYFPDLGFFAMREGTGKDPAEDEIEATIQDTPRGRNWDTNESVVGLDF
jgi:hypothetical protein